MKLTTTDIISFLLLREKSEHAGIILASVSLALLDKYMQLARKLEFAGGVKAVVRMTHVLDPPLHQSIGQTEAAYILAPVK